MIMSSILLYVIKLQFGVQYTRVVELQAWCCSLLLLLLISLAIGRFGILRISKFSFFCIATIVLRFWWNPISSSSSSVVKDYALITILLQCAFIEGDFFIACRAMYHYSLLSSSSSSASSCDEYQHYYYYDVLRRYLPITFLHASEDCLRYMLGHVKRHFTYANRISTSSNVIRDVLPDDAIIDLIIRLEHSNNCCANNNEYVERWRMVLFMQTLFVDAGLRPMTLFLLVLRSPTSPPSLLLQRLSTLMDVLRINKTEIVRTMKKKKKNTEEDEVVVIQEMMEVLTSVLEIVVCSATTPTQTQTPAVAEEGVPPPPDIMEFLEDFFEFTSSDIILLGPQHQEQEQVQELDYAIDVNVLLQAKLFEMMLGRSGHHRTVEIILFLLHQSR